MVISESLQAAVMAISPIALDSAYSCMYEGIGSAGICASVSPSTSEPSNRVDGDDAMTIFGTPWCRHASMIFRVPL